MIYKYLVKKGTEDLVGVYLDTPLYSPDLYTLGEATEIEGVELFGVVFAEMVEELNK
jgi:hypothetical protein